MYLHQFSIVIPLYLFLHHPFFLVTANSPGVDDIAVNCGSSGNSTGVDGRQWMGDILRSKHIISQGSKAKLISSTATEQPLSPAAVPYKTARISRGQFAYTFKVTSPGQKIIRLHFYPTPYRGGFKRSKAFFTVKAGPYTLLRNFSASLTADALGLQTLVKEFCVNVEDSQPLTITFAPSPSPGSNSDGEYAFVNGIEIISVPVGLYHTAREGDPSAKAVGKKYQFPIDKSIALETVQRLNVGGSSILPTEDTGMFREWSDSNFLLESNVVPASTSFQVKYTHVTAYTAPQKVYQTSWSMVTLTDNRQARKNFNFTWKLPVDLGFRYMLRLHFCELEYEITENGHKEFSIYVNGQMAEANADLIKWGGTNGVALYRDYVVLMEGDRMEGKRDLIIAVCPHMSHNYQWSQHADTILKGLEVFKLSNPDNNLAGVNPASLVHASITSNPKPRKSVLSWGGNSIATGVVILLTVLNTIVYQLRIVSEKFGGNNISAAPAEGLCRQFSLAEVLSATNSFADELVIGRGGFGKVYKALIDGGKTIVAIKRLHSKSHQGENEFRTEIEMLSKLRHTHLVSLLGYCNESHEMILVYEFMENGTLADHLYKINSNGDSNISPLSWEQRINICIGAARGLDYLHTGTRPGIIHRDVKTTNILLDKNWIAKISDFGLCKVGTTSHSCSHVSTNIKGTFGYFDPEYYLTHRLSRKSDVYSFGVVMMEVLCGRPALDMRLEEEQHSLAIWATHCIKEKKLDNIIDPSLREQISPQCLQAFADVASKCLHSRSNGRPTMADVVAGLGCTFSLQDQKKNPPTEEEEEEEEEEDFSIGGTDDRQIEDDLSQSTVPSPSTLVQPHNKKRSRGRLTVVLQSIGRLAKSIKESFFDVPAEADLEVYLGLAKRFSLRELCVATDEFSNKNILGRGAFCKVYKGRLADGSLVAVKRLNEKQIQGRNLQFQTEVEMLTKIVHRNLLRLHGFCMTSMERLLVYPYMANGSVASCLRERLESEPPLDWPTRKRIALGSARGLSYLHDYCDPKVIHRNVTAAHILLDEEFEAVVGGFALAKLMDYQDTHVTTAVRGTIGHIAPEYLSTGKASEKSDVFGYGIMLLELITGQRAFDLARLANDDDVMLLYWVKGLLRKNKLEFLIDLGLQKKYIEAEVEQLIQVALLCTQGSPTERPKMSEVVRMLAGDGLSERWEELQNVEVDREELELAPPQNFPLDSTYNLHAYELSGPR